MPSTSKLLAICPLSIAPPHIAKDLLEQVHRAAICPGNPDLEFLICAASEGVLFGEKEDTEMWWHSSAKSQLWTWEGKGIQQQFEE